MKPNDLHFLLILFFIVKVYGKCNESIGLHFTLNKGVGFLCQSFKVCLDKAACKNVIVIVIVIDGSVIVIVIVID